MNSIIKWIAKKYALSLINDALDAAKDKVDIEKYRAKIEEIMLVLVDVAKALKDNKITKDEANEIIDKTTELFK